MMNIEDRDVICLFLDVLAELETEIVFTFDAKDLIGKYADQFNLLVYWPQ